MNSRSFTATFRRLLLPAETKDVAIRLKARILAVLLIFFILVFGALDTYKSFTDPAYTIPWTGYVFLSASIVINAFGFYNVAAFLTAAMFPVVIFSSVVQSTEPNAYAVLNYLVLGLVFASILLGFRGTGILAMVQITGLCLLPWINPVVFPSLSSVAGPLALNFLSASLLLYFIYLRNHIENRRRQELVQSYEALATAEENLRKQEKFQERILHTSPFITYVFDLKEDRWVYASRSILEWLGHRDVQMEEFGARFREAYLHPDDHFLFRRMSDNWKTATDKDIQRLRLRCRDAAGGWRTFEINQSVFGRDTSGRVEQLIGSALDITEQRVLEERLQHAQKMETLGQLAGGIAHDFANMLTPIIGYSEMLLLDSKSSDPSYSELKSIHDAGNKAKYLIQQLLSFGRKQIMEIRDLELNDILRGFQKILRRTIRENVDIQYRLDDRIGGIRADQFQIEQIIMNMAVNAQDAMPNGGVLLFETSRTLLDEDYVEANPEAMVGPFVCITVSDNGAGMDDNTLRRVFEPFFTTKEQGKGTGLGLATVYGIVKQHGGHLTVYSEPGKGTTFRVYFPEAVGVVTKTAEKEEALELKGHGCIAVVEDNEMAREMVCRILKQRGFDTIDFETPAACVDYFRTTPSPVRLLVTDIIMPGMNGKELFLELKKIDPSLRVVYMSGYSENIISNQGVLEDGGILIPKPFSMEVFSRKIRQALAE